MFLKFSFQNKTKCYTESAAMRSGISLLFIKGNALFLFLLQPSKIKSEACKVKIYGDKNLWNNKFWFHMSEQIKTWWYFYFITKSYKDITNLFLIPKSPKVRKNKNCAFPLSILSRFLFSENHPKIAYIFDKKERLLTFGNMQ